MQYFYANFRYFAIIVVNYVYFILLMSGRKQTNLFDLLRLPPSLSNQAQDEYQRFRNNKIVIK